MSKSSHFSGQSLYGQVIKLLDKQCCPKRFLIKTKKVKLR